MHCQEKKKGLRPTDRKNTKKENSEISRWGNGGWRQKKGNNKDDSKSQE